MHRPISPGVSPEMAELIMQMLQLDETKRPTTEGIYLFKFFKFFRNFNTFLNYTKMV